MYLRNGFVRLCYNPIYDAAKKCGPVYFSHDMHSLVFKVMDLRNGFVRLCYNPNYDAAMRTCLLFS